MHDAGRDNLRNAFRMLAGGRMEGLETIWQESARPLHGYAFALTGDADEADDILSDVVAKLLRSRGRLRWVRNPKAYLFAAVRNAARDGAERRARAGSVALGGWPEPAAPDPTRAVDVLSAVMSLPHEQRETVVLHIWGGLTFREIGRLTGARPATATSRYRYGLEKLRKALGETDDE
jgi:RNA polymerase sigma-70 factor (ECF subfamily)